MLNSKITPRRQVQAVILLMVSIAAWTVAAPAVAANELCEVNPPNPPHEPGGTNCIPPGSVTLEKVAPPLVRELVANLAVADQQSGGARTLANKLTYETLLTGASAGQGSLSISAAQGGNCRVARDNSFTYQYEPYADVGNSQVMEWSYFLVAYQKDRVHRRPSGEQTWQVVICQHGGAQWRRNTSNAYRLTWLDMGLQADTSNNVLISHEGGWGENVSKLNWALDFGVKLGATISGSIGTGPTGLDRYSLRASAPSFHGGDPFGSANRQNRTWTWWVHNSPSWVAPERKGSTDWQGQGSTTLYEMGMESDPGLRLLGSGVNFHARCYYVRNPGSCGA